MFFNGGRCNRQECLNCNHHNEFIPFTSPKASLPLPNRLVPSDRRSLGWEFEEPVVEAMKENSAERKEESVFQVTAPDWDSDVEDDTANESVEWLEYRSSMDSLDAERVREKIQIVRKSVSRARMTEVDQELRQSSAVSSLTEVMNRKWVFPFFAFLFSQKTKNLRNKHWIGQ
jgi:hypothetical protein